MLLIKPFLLHDKEVKTKNLNILRTKRAFNPILVGLLVSRSMTEGGRSWRGGGGGKRYSPPPTIDITLLVRLGVKSRGTIMN